MERLLHAEIFFAVRGRMDDVITCSQFSDDASQRSEGGAAGAASTAQKLAPCDNLQDVDACLRESFHCLLLLLQVMVSTVGAGRRWLVLVGRYQGSTHF